jgi:hypothetical protein
MTPYERESLRIANVKGASENLVEIDSAKDLAIEHLFGRSNVARELHVAGMLLRRGIGRVSVEAARILAQTDSRFIRRDPNVRLSPRARYWLKRGERLRRVATVRAPMKRWDAGKLGRLVSEVVAKSEEQSRAVLPELLRSPGWINNAHQT